MEIKLKMKNYSKQYYNLKPKSPSASWLEVLFVSMVFCLSVSFANEQLDPTDLLPENPPAISANVKNTNASFKVVAYEQKTQSQSQTWDDQTVNSVENVDKDKDLLPSKTPGTQFGRQLWQSRIETIKDPNNEVKNDLLQTIEKVRSVEFKPQSKPAAPVTVINPAPKTQPGPNESQSHTEIPEEKTQPKLITESITKETLKIVEDSSLNSEMIKNPFELGEILFYKGHLKHAGICYQLALKQKDSEPNSSPQNTAWILFQIGNCLKNDDPNTAVKIYEQLVKEYPESIWTETAKTQIDLINWYLKDNPKTLIIKN
jgi:tetratricopeptide (TPR) repeat protein